MLIVGLGLLATGALRMIDEFEKARLEAKKELEKFNSGTTAEVNPLQDREKLESVASTLGINHSQLSDDELRSAIRAEINKDKA